MDFFLLNTVCKVLRI